MRRFKIPATVISLLVSFSLSGIMATQAALPMQVAAAPQSQSDACNGLSQLGGTPCAASGSNNSPGQDEIANIAKVVVNIISLITGIAAVIMIVVAGVKFVTSGGESSAVSSAKNTLVYAIIGLVIVALAQLIVHFVLNAVLTGSASSGTG